MAALGMRDIGQPDTEVTSAKAAKTVLVLGGSGFIGRHVASALHGTGCRVIVGSRHPQRHQRATGSDLQWRPTRLERLLAPDHWSPILHGCDVVVNCVGILRPRGRETYDRVHHLAPAALSAACATRGIRLVHLSALGLDAPVRSGFLRSKRDGEAAVRANGGDWHIVRPSLLDGEGGFGARWIRHAARWPLVPLPIDACGQIAALDVRDLAEAISNLALAEHPASRPSIRQREFDLGGPVPRVLAEHVAAMRRVDANSTPALVLPVPRMIARLASHLCDLLHLTPYSFGHWELLQRDNCPRHNHLPLLLGRAPRAVGLPAAAEPLPLAEPAGVAR